MFNPESFIEEVKPQILKEVREEKILAAISGGVDSTTAAVLMYKILGKQLLPIMIDTGFLRKDEARKVKDMLKDILPLQVVDKSEEFISALEGISDAEEKRKKFRDLFYSTLSAIAKENGIKYLVQGTIAADWVETQGGIKTQHNVLVQLGINTEETWGFKVIEPLVDLYKDEVRALARYLGLPKEISERQPFPGPGLLIRVVGKLTREKLEIEREVNDVVENELKDMGYSQYFSVIIDSQKSLDNIISMEANVPVYVYNTRATGVKGDVRSYGKIASIPLIDDYEKVREIVQKITKYDVTHVGMIINDKKDGKYSIGIRAVLTQDFMTADFAKIEISKLQEIGEKIMEINKEIKEVFYDVTSKPPATIEYE